MTSLRGIFLSMLLILVEHQDVTDAWNSDLLTERWKFQFTQTWLGWIQQQSKSLSGHSNRVFLEFRREAAVMTEFSEMCLIGIRQRAAGPALSGMHRVPRSLSRTEAEIHESAKSREGSVCALWWKQSAVEAGANDGGERCTAKGQTLNPQAARFASMHFSFLIYCQKDKCALSSAAV